MAEGVNIPNHYNGKEGGNNSSAPPSNTASGARSDQESDAESPGDMLIKGVKPKRSAFQITSVVAKTKDAPAGGEEVDGDSMDELEESRMDDFSSSDVLDTSKASLNSEGDRSIDEPSPSKSLPDRTMSSLKSVPSTEEITSNEVITETNGNGPSTRFKVVKVPNPEPVKRGRWTCKDFPIQNEDQASVDNSTKSDPSRENKSEDSSAASSLHTTIDVPSDNPSRNEAGHKLRASPSKSRDRKSSAIDAFMHTLDFGASSCVKLGNRLDADTSASGTGAIDNKIEQAMDLVKGHLLVAVREEVEVLKEKIKELIDLNEQLRQENSRLKEVSTASSQGHSIQHLSQGAPATDSQYQGINSALPTSHTPPSAYHQHSLPGQQPSTTSTTNQQIPTEPSHYQQTPSHHHSQSQGVDHYQQHTIAPTQQQPTQPSMPPSQQSSMPPSQQAPATQHVSDTAQSVAPTSTSTVNAGMPDQGQFAPPVQQQMSSQMLPHGVSPQGTQQQPRPDQQVQGQSTGIPHTTSPDQVQYQQNHQLVGMAHTSSTSHHPSLGASQDASQAVPPHQSGAPSLAPQSSTVPHGQNKPQL